MKPLIRAIEEIKGIQVKADRIRSVASLCCQIGEDIQDEEDATREDAFEAIDAMLDHLTVIFNLADSMTE